MEERVYKSEKCEAISGMQLSGNIQRECTSCIAGYLMILSVYLNFPIGSILIAIDKYIITQTKTMLIWLL
jgi:hypothetical protein